MSITSSQTNYNSLDGYKFARDNEVAYGGVYGYWQETRLDCRPECDPANDRDLAPEYVGVRAQASGAGWLKCR